MTDPTKSRSNVVEISRLDAPVVRGRCLKLRCRSDFQNKLGGNGLVLLLPTYYLLLYGYFGGGKYHYHPPIPALIPFGFATLAASIVLLTCFLGCWNYYLFDPVEHRLYRHFRFFWRVRTQLIFREGEILAITTDCQRRVFKNIYLWYYRIVAVGNNGHIEPLSNWREGSWEKMSAKARDLASQLGCPFHMAPAKEALSVNAAESPPMLRFDPHPKPQFPTPKRVILIVFGAAVPLIVLLYYFIVTRGTR